MNLLIKSFTITAAIMVACFIASLAITGCKSVQPGSDPLVVRAEQLETSADGAFQFVVSVDNADRGFWMTNAPAFHHFAEWLREKVPTPTNPNEPRGLGMILLVDSAKLQYEANKSQSNSLVTALADLQLAVNQASAWSTIVKTPTPP